MADPVLLINRGGDLRWGNAAAERLFDVTLADGVGRNMLEFIHPDDVEIALVAVEAMQAKDLGTLLELRIRGFDGWRLVEARGTSFGADILLTVRDISDRRRWEVASDAAAGFRALIQNGASITMVLEPGGEIRSTSSVVTRLLGHNQEQLEGARLERIVDPRDVPALTATLRALNVPGARPATLDLRLLHRGGDAVPFAMTFTSLLDDPSLAGIVATGHDISDRVTAEEQLRESNSLLATTLESTAEGLLVVDLNGRITTFNLRFAELWELPDDVRQAGDGARVLEVVLEQLVDPETCLAALNEVHADPEALWHDVLVFKSGRVLERHSRPRRLAGAVVGRVWSFRDITEHEQLKQQLAHQALHDALTGLANKTLFRERIDHALARLQRNGRRLAVLFVDLDEFKDVNDTLGHWAGDALLVQISERLTSQVRAIDTAARLGGDEFAVLIDDVADIGAVDEIVQRILGALREPIVIGTRHLSLTASIGIAHADATADPDELLRNADIAMYAAKADGKNCARAFTPAMHASALDRLDAQSAQLAESRG